MESPACANVKTTLAAVQLRHVSPVAVPVGGGASTKIEVVGVRSDDAVVAWPWGRLAKRL